MLFVARVQVLEKMRPLEARFNYQLDKLLRAATTGVVGTIGK